MDSNKRKNSVGNDLTVEVLNLIRESQLQHGLRHGDHQRYRQYITRKLRRIRKSLHLEQCTRHHRSFQKKPISKELLMERHDVRLLHIKLFQAERSWAFAMQLKTESNSEPRKRFHLFSRLRKGVIHAVEFSDLCQIPGMCDARTKLEAQAYAAWMTGCLHYEMRNWVQAKERFSAAQTIYYELSKVLDEQQSGKVYETRAQELEPQIRFCAYESGDTSAVEDLRAMRAVLAGGGQDVADLDQLLNQTRAAQAAAVTEVTWLGQVIPVRLEIPRVFLLSLREMAVNLANTKDNSSRLSLYETLIKDCQEAISAVKDELRQQEKVVSPGPVANDAVMTSNIAKLHQLHNYLMYLKFTKIAERNLIMINFTSSTSDSKSSSVPVSPTSTSVNASNKTSSSGRNSQELAKLYHSAIQSYLEALSLVNSSVVGNQHDEVNEAKVAVQTELQAKITAYKAFKCYHLSQVYLQEKKFLECSCLLERSIHYATTATRLISDSQSLLRKQDTIDSHSISREEESWQSLSSQLSELSKSAIADGYACRASHLLETISLSTASQEEHIPKSISSKPVLDRLSIYYEDPALLDTTGKHQATGGTNTTNFKLIQFPPDFQPIPAKPVFFDLASNYIEYPNLDDKVATSKQESGRGITGLVKGWLWGGEKK